MSSATLHLGDCLEILGTLEENSVDTVITDPPYGLSKQPDIKEVMRAWLAEEKFNGVKGGFMGKKWDSFVPGPRYWKEVYRVLKPGGMLLCFAGTRTADLMGIALRFAGFEIRDILLWLYASGFPKSRRLDLDASRCLPEGAFCQCVANMHNNGYTYPVHSVLDRICKVGISSEGEDVGLSSALDDLDIPEDFLANYQIGRHCDDGPLRQVARNVLAFALLREYAQEHNRLLWHDDDRVCESLHSLFRVLCSDLPSMRDYLLPSFWQHAVQLLQVYEDGSYRVGDLSKNVSKLVGSLDVSRLMDGGILASHKLHIYSLVFCLPLAFSRMLCDRKANTIIPQSDYCVKCGKIRNRWRGWGSCGLKPAFEPILVAMKPIEKTYAFNAQKWGVAGIWVDGGRIAVSQDDSNHRVPSDTQWGSSDATKNCYGKGLSGRPTENLTPSGRWPSNLLLSHSSDRECFCAGNWKECPYCNGTGIVEGCKRVGVRKVKGDKRDGSIRKTAKDGSPLARSWVNSSVQGIAIQGHADSEGYETIEEWDCVEGCPIKMLGEQSGEGKSIIRVSEDKDKQRSTWSLGRNGITPRGHNDTGTASRFFLNLPGETRFFYCPKASRRERNEGLEGKEKRFLATMGDGIGAREHNPKEPMAWVQNNHPTVKPRKLLEYLCRLTRTPTGGTVLDPFMGSGTTGLAAIKTDRDFIGIELDPDYFEIAEQRIESERTKMKQLELSGI